MTFYKTGGPKEATCQCRWKCIKQMKSDHVTSAIWIKCKWNDSRNHYYENVNIAIFWKTLNLQSEEHSEGDINMESTYDEKDKNIPDTGSVWQKLYIKGKLRYFIPLDVKRIKCWKHTNLENFEYDNSQRYRKDAHSIS